MSAGGKAVRQRQVQHPQQEPAPGDLLRGDGGAGYVAVYNSREIAPAPNTSRMTSSFM